MKIKAIQVCIPVLIAILVLAGCSSPGQAAQEPMSTTAGEGEAAPITAEGRIEPMRFANLALNTTGLVSEVLSSEGDQVEAGQLIARIENGQANTLEAAQAGALSRLTEAYKAVRDTRFKLDSFDVPSDFSGLTPTQAVTVTLEQLNAARGAYEPHRFLGRNHDKSGDYSKRLDDAWADHRRAIQWLELTSTLETALVDLEQAQRDYDSLLDTSFAEETAGRRAVLAGAELRAPFPATITRLDLKAGEYAAAGQPVVTIADASSWIVKTTDLTEMDVVKIEEGQAVEVMLDAIPGETFKGSVLSISPSHAEKQGDIVYEAAILLTDTHPAIRWGMTAEVRFVP